MTHAELVARAGKWLKGMGCSIVFTELVTASSEQPDAIGWRNSGQESFLVECKASRGDFRADRFKSFRDRGGLGMYRYFMCPAGMIKPDELPHGWGLLYAHPAAVDIVAGRHPRKYGQPDEETFTHVKNSHGEVKMLFSALNRLRLDLGDRDFTTRVHTSYKDRKKQRLQAANEIKLAIRPGPVQRALEAQLALIERLEQL